MAKNKAKTKSDIYKSLADSTGLTRKQIASVFDGLTAIVKNEVGKKGPGLFTLLGLLKLKKIHKPATTERPGKNPFTGEEMIIKAKPARNVIKAYPLKALKEMAK